MTTASRSTDYEAIASRYDTERADWDIPPDDVVATLGDGAAVLDLGCGTGNYLAAQSGHFPDRAIAWFGVDPSPGMLAFAAVKLDRARLVSGSAEALPFDDGVFDHVFCGWVFHHIDDKPAAVAEIVRVLRSGARFLMRNVDPWSLPDWWVYRFFPEAFDADQGRFWPVPKVAEAFHESGLDVDVELVPRERLIPVTEVLERARLRVTSQLAVIDDASYEEGLARIEAYVASDPDGLLDDGGMRLTITATKP